MRDAAYSINALTLSRTPDFASPMQATYHQTVEGPQPGYNFYALSVSPFLSSPLLIPLCSPFFIPPPPLSPLTSQTIFGDPLQAFGFQLLTESDGFGLNCPPRAPGQDCPYTYSPDNSGGVDAVFYQGDLEDLRLLLCRFDQSGLDTADDPNLGR